MSTASQTIPVSAVNRIPAADPETAAEHFRARFSFEVDVSDVHADLEAGIADFVVVDTRDEAAWEQGHIPAAVHLPTDLIPARAAELIDPATMVGHLLLGAGVQRGHPGLPTRSPRSATG